MSKTIAFLFLAAATTALAAERDPFPSDYTPHPCGPVSVCKSWDRSTFIAAGMRHRAVTLDSAWVDAHWDQMMAAVAPTCAKLGTCYATAKNRYLFCNELAEVEVRKLCNRYPFGSNDAQQCNAFLTAWVIGVDFNTKAIADEAQKCAAEKADAAGGGGATRKLDVWVVPETMPADFEGAFTVHAIDPETRVPIDAKLLIEGPRIYAPAAPDGRPGTGWPIKWKAAFLRAPNANGHSDVVPPNVTVDAPGYAPVSFRMPVKMPKMIVEMQPATLKPGKQSVTFTARDSVTGVPVEARAMMGDAILGNTNRALEVDIPKGKRAEIWVTDLFNRYSDVVVAPAK